MATRRGKGRGPKVTPKTGGQFALDYDKPKALPKKMTYAEWRKTLGPSAKVPVKPVPTVTYTRPPFSSGQTPSNASGAAEKTGKTTPNWRFGNKGQSIPAGRRVMPVVEATGRSAVPYNRFQYTIPPEKPPEKPVFNTPKKPPLRLPSPGGVKYVIDEMGNNVPKPDDYKKLAKFGKAAWKLSKIPRALSLPGLGAMVLEEALFPTVYDSEETSSVLAEEQAEFDEDNLKDITEAQDRVNLLTEIGASPEQLADANRKLTELKTSIDPQQSITEWENDVKEDLKNNQLMIDNKISELSNYPEALRLNIKPLLERRDALEAKLADATSWRKNIADKATVQKDPDALSLMSMAQGIDPSKLLPQLGSEDKTTIEKEGDGALEKLFNGTVKTLKGAMTLAAEGLGSLWGETAIKNALIYYMGARLMGYSASGSGMAAGDVLIKGWETQAAADVVTAKADAEAAKDAAIDQTKSVQMWDKKTKKIIDGYASKDGKSFYQVTDKGLARDGDGELIVINPVSSGLVTYKSGTHKTFEEIKASLLDSTNKNTNDVIKKLNANPDYKASDLAALNQNFGDGRAAREVLEVITREMEEAGTDYGTASFNIMFQNLMTTTMEKQAKGLRKGDHGEEMSSMIGEWREMQLKDSLTGEGDIPAFIYGKATEWDAGGAVVEYEDGFDASGHAKGELETKIESIKNYWVKSAIKNGTSEQKANERITTTRVVQELGRLFKSTVMKDPNARKYWTGQAGDRSNAFMAWMTSNDTKTINHEHQYLGLNAPEVRAMGPSIDFSKPFKKIKKK